MLKLNAITIKFKYYISVNVKQALVRLGRIGWSTQIVLFIIFALTFIGPINSGDFEQSFVTNSISTSIITIVSIKQLCILSPEEK